MSRFFRIILLVSLLAVGLSTAPGVQAATYYRRWMAPYPTYTCATNGSNVDITLSSQPAEWNLPADNEIHLIYIDNGIVVGDTPFTVAPPLVSSQVYGSFLETVPGPYPVTFDFRMDTYVAGELVYQSTLSVACSADSSGTVTVVNSAITLPPAPGTAPLPGPDMVNIPSTAVVGAMLTTTPAYFAPQAGAVTTTSLAAGKTFWVFGVDASGGFYKVMMAGKFFWVPVSAMGPNYDAVWNGKPLPTNVVS